MNCNIECKKCRYFDGYQSNKVVWALPYKYALPQKSGSCPKSIKGGKVCHFGERGDEVGKVSIDGILIIASFVLLGLGLFPFCLEYTFIPYIMMTVGLIGFIFTQFYWKKKHNTLQFSTSKDSNTKAYDSKNNYGYWDSGIDRKKCNSSSGIIDKVKNTQDKKNNKSDCHSIPPKSKS